MPQNSGYAARRPRLASSAGHAARSGRGGSLVCRLGATVGLLAICAAVCAGATWPPAILHPPKAGAPVGLVSFGFEPGSQKNEFNVTLNVRWDPSTTEINTLLKLVSEDGSTQILRVPLTLAVPTPAGPGPVTGWVMFTVDRAVLDRCIIEVYHKRRTEATSVLAIARPAEWLEVQTATRPAGATQQPTTRPEDDRPAR